MIARTSLLRPLALAAMLAASGASQAGLTVFTDQASFLAAVGMSGTDTFDDLTAGANLGSGPFTRSAGSFGYSVSAGPTSDILYGAGTLDDAWLSTNNAKDTVTFTGFSAGTAAAGGFFFGSDISGNLLERGVVVVTAADASGATSQQFKLRAGEETFFGFVSDTALTSLSVRVLSGQRSPVWPTIDDLTLAAAVPEPQTYAMLLAGLGVVGFLARRRSA